ncbi:MAG TPA: hypothetical protein VFT99_11675, partial [Roseiflexaceae bacterium]|nr:hypothetical protein [Roseiflexaceae bacterium]
MDDTLADVLQECLDRLAGGATVDQCVQRFPQQRLELEPMLQAVAALRKLPHPAMPVAAQAAIEARVLQQVALRRAAPPPHAASQPAVHPLAATWHGIPVWALLLAAAMVVALLLALGTLVGGTPNTSRATATPLATAQNPAPNPTGSLFSTPLPGAQSEDATPAPASAATSTTVPPDTTPTIP